MFRIIKDMPLAGVLNTNVDVEGQGKGIDAARAKEFISGCPHPVIASGGISSEEDVALLAAAGAESAVVGIAIYTGIISPWEWKMPWNI
jgi:phosphoribosylformimino-5-aminoimidazole carboxamide ribotide isomerase